MSVSTAQGVEPAANTADERTGCCNSNLPGVKYPLELARELAAGSNFHQVSATAISTGPSLAQGLEGEWLLQGVPTWVADVLAGCWAPEASIERCSVELLSCSCSETTEARL